MAQYINKDALIAEIEKLVDKGKYHEEYDCAYRDGNNGALYALKNKLNTLDVKEVDLEKEIKSWLDHGHITDTRYDDYDDNDIESTAKHFFEIGLKAQKGE